MAKGKGKKKEPEREPDAEPEREPDAEPEVDAPEDEAVMPRPTEIFGPEDEIEEIPMQDVLESAQEIEVIVNTLVLREMADHDERVARMVGRQLSGVARKIDNFGFAVRKVKDLEAKVSQLLWMIEQLYEDRDLTHLTLEDVSGITWPRLKGAAMTRYNPPVRRRLFFREARGEVKASDVKFPQTKARPSWRLGDKLLLLVVAGTVFVMMTKFFGVW